MAEKGTYSSYAQQPQISGGSFEGAEAFSQMANRKAREKAIDKQYQRKMQAEGRKAVQNAMEAANIDLSKFDDSVYGLVGKMLNQYGDEVVDAAEGLEDGYSYESEMRLTRLRSKFHSNVGQLMGLGNSIKTIQEMDLDPILSLEAINGLSDFIKGVPQMAENFDPKTMSVNGKHIVSKFNEMVPKDKLIPFTDTSESFRDFRELVMEDPKQKIIQKGDVEETYEIRDFDSQVARADFLKTFPSKSKEFRKEAFSLKARYEGMEEGEEKDAFAARYLERTSEDDFVVTPNTLYNYVEDEYLEPYRNRKTKSEQINTRAGQLTTNQRNKLAKERMSNLRRIEVLHESATSDGMTGLVDSEIQVDNVKGTIQEGRLRYNPVTGKQDIAIKYSVSDNDDNVSEYVAWFDNNERGIQALGNSVFDDFDYIQTKRNADTEEPLDVPREARTFEQRESDIQWVLKNQTGAITRRITKTAARGDNRSADERVFGYLSKPFEESNEPNRGLLAFMAKYLDVKEDVTGGIELPDGVSVKNTIDLDEMEPLEASRKIAQYTLIARRLKQEGKGDDEIAAELALHNNKGDDIDYEFDPIIKRVEDLAGGDYSERTEYLEYASKLMRDGLSDQEVLRQLKEGVLESKNAAQNRTPSGATTFPQEVIDSLKTVRDDLSDDEINAVLQELMTGEDALTYDEIVELYTD